MPVYANRLERHNRRVVWLQVQVLLRALMPKCIYLAAPYGRRQYLREEVAPALRALGHRITSSWINDPPENDVAADYLRARKRGELVRNDFHEKQLEHEAQRDVLDVQNSDMLIRFPAVELTTPSSGGKFWETGMAHAMGLEIIVVGNKETVFDYLSTIQVLPDFEAVLERVK